MKAFFYVLILFTPCISFAQMGGALEIEVVEKGALRTPIDSAKITAVGSGRDSLIGYTDSTGHCKIDPVTSGDYFITVEKHGYGTFIVRHVVVSENKTTYLVGPNAIELSRIGNSQLVEPKKP